MRHLIAAAALLLAVPATGFSAAPSESGDVTLAAAPAKSEFIIDGAAWSCEGQTCHAPYVADMPAVRSCRRIVRETGAVTAFRYRGHDLTAAELADCNSKAKA